LAEQRGDRFTELEEPYSGYEVYDRDGEKIGKVDDLFVDGDDQPEYLGVKTGLLDTRSTLIPMEAAQVDKRRHVVEVSQPKSMVKEGPAFDDDEEITPEHEQRVREHYGLNGRKSSADRGGYGDYRPGGGPTTGTEKATSGATTQPLVAPAEGAAATWSTGTNSGCSGPRRS
jgi:hypothetical protein